MDMSREPGQGDLVARDLADEVYSVLAAGDTSPLGYVQIAERLVQRGRLEGDPGALATPVAAAIRADGRRRERPRFRYLDGRVALVDWWLPRDAVRQEREAVRFAERQRDQVRRAFLRKLQELPATGFVEMIATWLNAEGVSKLRAVRRPGSTRDEIHLAGVMRRGPETTRIALVLLREGREVGRDRVIDLRGELHHYGERGASVGWIISTGPVSQSAREESEVPGTAPIATFDGMTLAEAMEARRIGLVPVSLPLATIDQDLFDALRGSPEPILRGGGDRDERRDDRDRRDHGERRDEGAPPAAAGEGGGAPQQGQPQGQPQGQQGQGEERGGRRRRRRRGRGRGRDDQGVQQPGAPVPEGAEAEGAEGEAEDLPEEEQTPEERFAQAAEAADAPERDEEDEDEDEDELAPVASTMPTEEDDEDRDELAEEERRVPDDLDEDEDEPEEDDEDDET
jgi:hypothetical protein